MKIIDLDGNTLEVTNLDEATRQAELFKDFRHEDPEYKISDERNQKYWTDIYLKLLKLKNGIKKTG